MADGPLGECMSKSKNKVYILGAGPAGLVAAWKLLQSGWEVEVFEREPTVGGMCKTWQWGEFLVDVGPHIFHTPDKELAELWEREFGDLLVKDDFWCKNVNGDKFDTYWDYPISWESISRYPKDLKQKILNELSSLNLTEKAKASNYKEYVENLVGPTLQRMFFEKYPFKIWNLSTKEMTSDWAPKRIEFRNKVTPFYVNQWNAVGKFGSGCIFDRFKDEIIKMGGKIHLNVAVTGFVHDSKRIKSIKLTDGTKTSVLCNEIIISTLPITHIAKLLDRDCNLKFRGIISVYLAYDKASVLPEGIHWLYYDSEKVFFNRITEPKKLTQYVAPKGQTFITCEIVYSNGDEKDVMSKNDLIKAIADQVEFVGLSKASDVIAADIHKEEFIYPIMYKGYKQELASVKATLASFEQLYTIGTGADFHYADVQILFHKAFDLVEVLNDKYSYQTQVKRRSTLNKLNKIVNINGKVIGDGYAPYVIAEAGLNHNGSLELARRLVDEAKLVGCDAIKFQAFKASNRISNKVKTAKYAETIIGTEETILEMFQRLEMSHDDQRKLFDYAHSKGIEIFSTPFDLESVDFLETLDVNLYKISSMDLVNLPLIEYVAKTGKPLIISVGMSTLGQVEEAVQTVLDAGNSNLMLLHCNSTYPAAPEEMNLRCIDTLKRAFCVPVGLSDHTFGIFISQIAMAIGANIIERHFTINRTFDGPDHILSSEPSEFAKLVEGSKMIPVILGDGIKRVQPSEYDTINQQRKSIYAKSDIRKGQIITFADLTIKGPGGGLLPKYLNIVIGREAKTNIDQDHPISWGVI